MVELEACWFVKFSSSKIFLFVLKLANLLNETGEFDFQIFGRWVARHKGIEREPRGGTRNALAQCRASRATKR